MYVFNELDYAKVVTLITNSLFTESETTFKNLFKDDEILNKILSGKYLSE
jgi:hypothetical protein